MSLDKEEMFKRFQDPLGDVDSQKLNFNRLYDDYFVRKDFSGLVADIVPFMSMQKEAVDTGVQQYLVKRVNNGYLLYTFPEVDGVVRASILRPNGKVK